MPLTDEQANAVDLFKQGGSLKISALAGTGKTKTLFAIATSRSSQGLYLAFNHKVVLEAKNKFPATVACRTTHAIALKAVGGLFGNDDKKLRGSIQGNRIAQTLGLRAFSFGGITLDARAIGFLIVKTVERFCQSADPAITSRHVPLPDKLRTLDANEQEEFKHHLSSLATAAWRRMSSPRDQLPLGHSGYLKLWALSNPQLHYDFILLDESQDTNAAVMAVLMAQPAQLGLVGDRHQQIYEWRGAINAMDLVKTSAESFLTQSFRFGPEIAEPATKILRLLGEERSLIGNPERRSSIATLGHANATLCRTNAGVMAVVIQTLEEGRRPHVLGGVFELHRLLDDVSRLEAGLPAESTELFGFKDWAEVDQFARTEEGQSLASFVGVVNRTGAERLKQALGRVVRDEESADVTVSTGHKAKGHEWDTVRLHTDFEPTRFDPKDPATPVLTDTQARLLYVATTRARLKLIAPSKLARFWGIEPRDRTASDRGRKATTLTTSAGRSAKRPFVEPPSTGWITTGLPDRPKVIQDVASPPMNPVKQADRPTPSRQTTKARGLFGSLLRAIIGLK